MVMSGCALTAGLFFCDPDGVHRACGPVMYHAYIEDNGETDSGARNCTRNERYVAVPTWRPGIYATFQIVEQ